MNWSFHGDFHVCLQTSSLSVWKFRQFRFEGLLDPYGICLWTKLSTFACILICGKYESVFSRQATGLCSRCHNVARLTIIACPKCQLMSALSPIHLSINGCLQGLETIQVTSGGIIIALVAEQLGYFMDILGCQKSESILKRVCSIR